MEYSDDPEIRDKAKTVGLAGNIATVATVGGFVGGATYFVIGGLVGGVYWGLGELFGWYMEEFF